MQWPMVAEWVHGSILNLMAHDPDLTRMYFSIQPFFSATTLSSSDFQKVTSFWALSCATKGAKHDDRF